MNAPPGLSPQAARFFQLQAILVAHEGLWRPAPFHVRRPGWCETWPELAEHVLGLPEAEVGRLAADNAALIDRIAAFIPELSALRRLIELPRADQPGAGAASRLGWQVPGRKLAQVEAFTGAMGAPVQAVLEWCSGKGHLGRWLASRWGVPVASLDHDAALCAEGDALARRAGIGQRFICADALDPASARHLAGRHAIALHACGDLHLALIRGAVIDGAAALDLSPCCYYRTASAEYRPLNPDAHLKLSRDELHLAVTDTATAGARDIRLRDRGMAWKLAFLMLREEDAGIDPARPFKPVPSAWAAPGFESWCRRLAEREGLVLPGGTDWARLEAAGWARQREVVRLELVRHVFRRPLEIWLALDRVLFLERAGYHVRLAEFCDRDLTPRNLLISARRY